MSKIQKNKEYPFKSSSSSSFHPSSTRLRLKDPSLRYLETHNDQFQRLWHLTCRSSILLVDPPPPPPPADYCKTKAIEVENKRVTVTVTEHSKWYLLVFIALVLAASEG